MDTEQWLEIAVNTTPDHLEEVAARLTFAGVTGLVIEDEGEFHRFLEEHRPHWDYVDAELEERMRGLCRVKFYVPDSEHGRRQLEQYTRGLGWEHTVTPLAEEDWAYSWQQHYKPLAVGRRLYIVPQWERDTPIPPGRTPLYLNPGLTFGTGTHASTQLCLEGVEARAKPGDRVLDLGCGSGILSIAALVLGAQSALAVDLDPKAGRVSAENAALNGLDEARYRALHGDILADPDLGGALTGQTYHLVLANIVADVIIPLAPHVPTLLAEGGVFLCSGILDARRDEVETALTRNGLRVIARREKDGWAALEAERG